MFLSLTLVGLGVSSDQVLEFKAVGSHLLLRLTAHRCHVAFIHLAGAAAGPRVEAHAERLIWEAEGEGIDSAGSTDIFHSHGRSVSSNAEQRVDSLQNRPSNSTLTLNNKV